MENIFVIDKTKRYVWYASYGSNMLRERFMLYIEGGVNRFNGRSYEGCKDKSAPIQDQKVEIHHELYFAKHSSSWGNGGVAFIKPDKNEATKTLGRMYLITEEQFKEVQRQEGPGWYNKVIELGNCEGFPIKTFTHSEEYASNTPVKSYLDVIRQGIREVWSEKKEWEIEEYLRGYI